ncbi:MAG: hypothetical protein COW01_11195 [Bdellovibrionales bacterium CG12_big_fil_rev_8_21_14_0_65_38_15]|nr:MAG: hypothetical protein COW79_11225 [Bdellovibrionales bacterium CG22_combo_CG10-13_8_21_14_all_38_13]PIQ54177.1 MAG: hypothetical protein COW01_11195 [Bdellovibrionales bacterium CG12_big_fil_rev_8_21_14_0_65_38_15]PIR29235.1 MAG: hypothetical protein COV38_10840 [Bdellovibrionales bacterium CG11_big_fil_rev_8_21_14_0_20_38_13]
MCKIKTLLILNIFLISLNVFAQSDIELDDFTLAQTAQAEIDLQSYELVKEELLSGSFSDSSLSVNIDKNLLIKVLGASAAAIVFFQNDQEIMDFVQDNQNDVTHVVSNIGEALAHPEYIAVGSYLLGVVLKDGKIKTMSMVMAKTAVISGLITQAIKMSVGRERPNQHHGPYEFHGASYPNEHVSFPSGHTTSAFAMATVIAETYKGESKMIPILAYSAAVVAGWSRVHDEAHWASDVVIGALIGHLTAKYIMRKFDQTDDGTRNRNSSIQIIPIAGFDFMGVNVHITERREVEVLDPYLF